MGKKKNKKFKVKPTYSAPIIGEAKAAVTRDENEAKTITKRSETEITKDHYKELDAQYAYVRKDTYKLLVMIGVLAFVFVGIYFLNLKTSFLADLGHWFYKIANFQI